MSAADMGMTALPTQTEEQRAVATDYLRRTHGRPAYAVLGRDREPRRFPCDICGICLPVAREIGWPEF